MGSAYQPLILAAGVMVLLLALSTLLWPDLATLAVIPVVLMEAMASGVPVVASRMSGIPELVEDGVSGLLIEPCQPEVLAAALSSLHQDTQRWQRLSAGGRERVVRGFDLTHNSDLLIQTFRNGRKT
jgi:glycosyltransferase involved in cell wall biosynthesis